MSSRHGETKKLIAIEKRSVQLLLLLLLASLWFQDWSISLGLILGGGVAILNFRWLWRILEKVLFEQKKFYGIQVLMKFILVGILIFFILRYLAVNPIAFIVGLSTLVLGILFEVFRESLRPERKGNV